MNTRGIFTFLPALPLDAGALLPKRPLAAMRSSLEAVGRETLCLDFGSLAHVSWLQSQAAALAERRRPARRLFREGTPGIPFGKLAQAQARHAATLVAKVGSPDFVVILVRNHAEFCQASLFSTCLRRLAPSLVQVLTGSHVDAYGSLLLRDGYFDCGCASTPENCLAALVDRLGDKESWGRLPGVFVPGGDSAPQHWKGLVTRTAIPALPSYPVEPPTGRSPEQFLLFDVLQSRGLEGQAFHAAPRAASPMPCHRSTWRVLEEMAALEHVHGVRVFHVMGEGTPLPEILELAEQLCRFPHRQYSRAGLLEQLEPYSAQRLAQSGCRVLTLRVESGSQRLLDRFHGRGFEITHCEQVLRACGAAGIYSASGFIYPCPEDDYHSREETARLIRRGQPGSVTLSLPEVLPGSAWRQSPEAYGFRACHPFGGWHEWERARGWCVGARAGHDFRMRGWSSARIAREQQLLRAAILEARVHYGIVGRVALLARLSGYDGMEDVYAARLGKALRSLDVEELSVLMQLYNHHAALTAPVKSYRVAQERAAVGN